MYGYVLPLPISPPVNYCNNPFPPLPFLPSISLSSSLPRFLLYPQFQEERLWASASLLVTFDNILRDTIAYSRDRKIFGRAVLDHQVVHFRLAELATEVCRSQYSPRRPDLIEIAIAFKLREVDLLDV